MMLVLAVALMVLGPVCAALVAVGAPIVLGMMAVDGARWHREEAAEAAPGSRRAVTRPASNNTQLTA